MSVSNNTLEVTFRPTKRVVRDERSPSDHEVRAEADEVSKRSRRLPKLIRGSEVRKIRTRSKVGYTGDVPLTRLRGKVVSGESMLELDFLLLVDFVEPDLLDVVAQPFRLPLLLPGRRSSWVPDFLVVRKDRADELVEVKTLESVHRGDPGDALRIRSRLSAMKRAANDSGFGFRLVTEHEIRVQPRLDQARVMHRAMSPFVSARDQIDAVVAMRTLPPTSDVADLERLLPERLRPVSLTMALRLDRLGLLKLDRRQPFTRTSRFDRLDRTDVPA